MRSDDFERLPRHIAFIMDGNGRWAKKRGLSRKNGHVQGVKTLERIVRYVFDLKIPYMTVYAFSTENWSRPQDEIDALIQLIRTYFSDYFKKLSDDNIKINVLGDISVFPQDVKNMIEEVTKIVPKQINGTINVALNYGSRKEIVNAVNRAIDLGVKISEDDFSKMLYTGEMPDPDLIIRTGGEMRLSNFLLFQAAYSELLFCDVFWPDFGKKELYSALKEYSGRNRRFGKV